jgi:4a-hydroxytetrahydrobiopterin dehydratase
MRLSRRAAERGARAVSAVAREHVKARLAAALPAGGRIVDESHAPSHWTLADLVGNRVCIRAWPDGLSNER